MLLIPLTANSINTIGDPVNGGCTAQTTRPNILHLSGSEGNFNRVQQDMGLSLAHTALSTSPGLLSFFTADNTYFFAYIIAKIKAYVKQSPRIKYKL